MYGGCNEERLKAGDPMKLSAIVIVLLAATAAVAQQPAAQSSAQAQTAQTLKDCQVARAFLEKQLMTDAFRSMTAAQMQNYAVAIANCVRVDKEGRDADQKLSFQLTEMLNMRLRMFVLMNGLWDRFAKWDADLHNLIASQSAGPGRIVSEERVSWRGENGVAATIWLKRGTNRLQGVKQVVLNFLGAKCKLQAG